MIVRHETGRVGRGAAVRVDYARAAQVRGGRVVEARLRGLADAAIICAGWLGAYTTFVLLVRAAVWIGETFVY